ncbi:MAG: alpha/beta fold hydrolase [Desulfobacteraceae bacterium]|nr:alpha/beta fold hydrolase [Desulfobacteraceae bacterium]
MKNTIYRRRVLVVAGIAAVCVLIGAVYLKTIPVNCVRYLIWRLTSTACVTKGAVRVGDTDIHYVSYGSGPPVLLLHGRLSSRLSWFSQIPRLVATGRQVVLPDTRGHGDSPLGRAELTYRLFAADAAMILDRLSIAKTDVVSTSHARLMAEWLVHGSLAIVAGGHFTPVTQARRINALIAEFLGPVASEMD